MSEKRTIEEIRELFGLPEHWPDHIDSTEELWNNLSEEEKIEIKERAELTTPYLLRELGLLPKEATG